jgi:hypothetical protein
VDDSNAADRLNELSCQLMRWLLLIGLALGLAGCGASTPQVDQAARVRAAASSFVGSINDGVTGAACDDLSTAARARYDQQAQQIGGSCGDVMPTHIAGIPESPTITGSAADVVMSGGVAIHLVLEGGAWKVDDFG